MASALSTGMGNLDNKFERGGFHPGSVVTVQTPPAALGQVVLYNLSAGRPTTYVSVGPCDDETEGLLVAAGGLDATRLRIEELSSKNPASALETLLDKLELHEGETLLVEPMNLIEKHADSATYTALLATLSETVKEANGLCGLLAVETERVPENRWQTIHHAETVLTVIHEVSRRTVHDHLALEKLHPRQALRDNDDRVFRLPRSLEIDIDTKKNLSP